MKKIKFIFDETMGNKNYYFAYDYDADKWVTENPIELFEKELLKNGYTFNQLDENLFEINGDVYIFDSKVVGVYDSDTSEAWVEDEDNVGENIQFQGEWHYNYQNLIEENDVSI